MKNFVLYLVYMSCKSWLAFLCGTELPVWALIFFFFWVTSRKYFRVWLYTIISPLSFACGFLFLFLFICLKFCILVVISYLSILLIFNISVYVSWNTRLICRLLSQSACFINNQAVINWCHDCHASTLIVAYHILD